MPGWRPIPDDYAPIHMTAPDWQEVLSILRQHARGHSVWAFGSRATGKRLKPFSDLDLAVAPPLPAMQHSDLIDSFDESLLPFKVDIVEIDTLDPAFLARIRPDFVPLTGPAAARMEIGPPAGEDVQSPSAPS